MADKYIRLTTPKGTAQYPWLSKPDTKFNDKGTYKVNIIVPAKEAQAFIKKVTEIRDQFFAQEKTKKKAQLPFAKEVDDQGNETGNVVIKCKVDNRDDWDRKPKQFDASGNRIDKNVGGGSILKANVQVYTWNVSSLGVGVTLQPVAVQVIELNEFGGSDNAEDFGFEKEDGFVSDEAFEEETNEETLPDEETSDSDLY